MALIEAHILMTTPQLENYL